MCNGHEQRKSSIHRAFSAKALTLRSAGHRTAHRPGACGSSGGSGQQNSPGLPGGRGGQFLRGQDAAALERAQVDSSGCPRRWKSKVGRLSQWAKWAALPDAHARLAGKPTNCLAPPQGADLREARKYINYSPPYLMEANLTNQQRGARRNFYNSLRPLRTITIRVSACCPARRMMGRSAPHTGASMKKPFCLMDQPCWAASCRRAASKPTTA